MDVFDLVAKITLDDGDYNKGLDDASKKTSTFGSKVKSGLATAGKVAAAGLGVATAAVGGLSKAALDSYASYEQLVGGVDTLFKTSSQAVQDYAANAYTTAGMSANEYMETVTGFSASLIQSLGGDTAAAAEVANVAITDMSDNANKMGTDMESIQNAYQGFAKQNYTMLDNLKLGYGGTKEEMQRLIDDANRVREANGEMGDLSIESFADVTTAIHTMQEEMGIAGTTQTEAATTIEGSLGMVRGAWSNLMTGIADENANMGELVGQLTESISTAAGNIAPRISEILSGLGEAVTQLAPVISEQVPALIETVVPSFMEAGGTLLEGLIQGLITALPSLVEPAIELATQFVQFLIDNLPLLIDGALQLMVAFAEGIVNALPELIPAAVEAIATIVRTLIENIPMLLQAAVQLLQGIVQGFLNAFPALKKVWESVKSAILGAWEGIKTGVAGAVDKVREKISNVFNAVKTIVLNIWNGIKTTIMNVWNGIKTTVGGAVDSVKEKVSGVFGKVKETVSNVWNGIKTTISNVWNGIKEKVSGAVENVKEKVSNVFHSVKDTVSDIWEGIKDKIRKPIESARDLVRKAIDKIKGFFDFDWELPKLKLPHFSIEGKFSLNPISVPHFSIDWYRKAMDNPMLLDGATIFGAAGGKLLGGGEAGTEIVSGADTLMGMISKAVRQSGGGTVINITVNGANIQNDRELAERISEEMQYLLERRAAAVGAG